MNCPDVNSRDRIQGQLVGFEASSDSRAALLLVGTKIPSGQAVDSLNLLPLFTGQDGFELRWLSADAGW